ncbi:DUF3298 domain-containing protein [uncultured Bacteroides sp.]|uniref:DUF3298 and DUF4163 domain-containing protein n=1 Tax=uncultured Bacteroides sp. TaxID=162156 RepID=UPI002AAB8E78|nr:DUF3298 domain-containing protein [uncultured Bacteroides sp.]
MKRNSLAILPIILLAGTVFFSCGGKKQKESNQLTTDSILVKETSHLFNDTKKPACNLDINFTYITKASNKAIQDSMNNRLLATCLGNEYIGKDPKTAVAQFKAAYEKGYKNDVEQFYLEDQKKNAEEEVNSAWYNYNKSIKSRVIFNKDGVLVYRVDTYDYTGGAHGNHASLFLNFDLLTGKQIHLKNLFKEGYEKVLTGLLVAQLEKDNKVTSEAELEEIGYFITEPLSPTENFLLNKDGFTFFYNVYEIAPYVMGTTTIKLPFSAVESLMKEGNPAEGLY